ncbi:MAG: dihydroorotate dehydrogenase-like protein [Acidobacteria bacterium]|nr:dihydroorotate dehydrogenase-like protein [Acidobacteriota bacterium]
MDLSTSYLGFQLPHPLMPGASPMVDNLDIVKRLEDAGAAAIVMHSLFEEQIARDQTSLFHHTEIHAESFAEATSYLPRAEEFVLGPEEYLEHVAKIKRAVALPIIASLNGITSRGWVQYARKIEQAGADALELNIYYIATDLLETGSAVEGRALEVLQAVKRVVTIPVAVKLSPFYSAIVHFARELDHAGADGIVLFNRFYQPDIDVEQLETVPLLTLSTSSELRLRMRWLAALSGRVKASLAASGGVHTPVDVIKAVMTGAHAVQVVSALLQHGPEYLRVLREGVATWLEQHEYDSLKQMQGSMSLEKCPDPAAFERANYMRVLQGWKC